MNATRVVRFLQGRYFLYCTQAWQRAAALTVLRIPITSPPVTADTFRPQWMAGKKVLIFKLHGYPDRPDWYGMDSRGEKVIALTPALVQCADLAGAIIVAIVCQGAGGEMEKAFYNAGAIAFFGSRHEVRARERRPGEADVLASYLLRRLAKSPQDLVGALARAKEIYRAKKDVLTEHDRHTLETFNLTEKGGIHV